MTIIPLKGSRQPPRAQRSTMETLIVSVEEVEKWQLPKFQRPVRVNAKVLAIAEELKHNGGVMTGILTLGRIGTDPTLWLVDGSHRREAFKHSGAHEMLVDVRICEFDSMAEMAKEFERLNTAIVRMRPDDVLRALEENLQPLQLIRQKCEFVGYDNIRRNGTKTPVVGMSALLRCWHGSRGETPTLQSISAAQHGQTLDTVDAESLIVYLLTAHQAWGRDPEYYRLWANLNLTMTMWMFRHLVLNRDRGVKRSVSLTVMQFKQCLTAISANGDYLDWLTGRILSERDRSPCYQRLKSIFVKRLMTEAANGKRPLLPSPPWAS
jgi:hypothetical protein